MSVARLRGGAFTTSDGCRLAHLAVGEGPALAMVHGGLGRGSAWMGVADALADRFTCHLLDQRGHGASDWGGGPSLEAAVTDLLAFLRLVGPVEAVVGHSFGAVVALEAALASPADVPRLVLYEPPLPCGGPLMDEPTLAAVERAVADGEVEQALLAHLAAAGGGMAPAEVEALRANPMLRATWADLAIQAASIAPGLRGVNRLGDVTRYAGVEVPITVLLGSESPQHPFVAAADALRATLPDVRVAPLAGQGHLALLMAPHLVATAIEAALGGAAGGVR